MNRTSDSDDIVQARPGSVVELAVDPLGDPGCRKLAAAINAQFAWEAATRRRRIWTLAVALLGFPSTLAVVYPGALTPVARRADAAAWALAAVALTASLVSEVRRSRALERLRRNAADGDSRRRPPSSSWR